VARLAFISSITGLSIISFPKGEHVDELELSPEREAHPTYKRSSFHEKKAITREKSFAVQREGNISYHSFS
jgi:hypothetical protein